MKAMVLNKLVSLSESLEPLVMRDIPEPQPAEDEVLIRVSTCGVCHTELDEIEGRTSPSYFPIVLGHEVVGRIVEMGAAVDRFQLGDRVGVGWIHRSTGADDENLSEDFRATGRDVNGGYAELMTVGQRYAYPIPDIFSDLQAAPLLCAGGIGYRAFRLANVGHQDSLGLMGFGASAHLMLQYLRYFEPELGIFAFAREAAQREFAKELGAVWAGDIQESPPQLLHAIVDTTPAWLPVLCALENLLPGGRLVINAIRKEDRDRELLGGLSYQRHLWMEKEIKTVANITHQDLSEYLPRAAEIPIMPKVTEYPLEQANEALHVMRRGGTRGALVLRVH